MARAKVTRIVHPGDVVGRYSRYDTRPGSTERGGLQLPRTLMVPGYGRVFFFTRSHGSSYTGVMIVTEVLGGELHGHQIRYMHMGMVHPELAVGDVVEAGQEIALMGATAVQSSRPHVHIDIENQQGRRIDVAPFLGLKPDPTTCRSKLKSKKKSKKKRSKKKASRRSKKTTSKKKAKRSKRKKAAKKTSRKRKASKKSSKKKASKKSRKKRKKRKKKRRR